MPPSWAQRKHFQVGDTANLADGLFSLSALDHIQVTTFFLRVLSLLLVTSHRCLPEPPKFG